MRLRAILLACAATMAAPMAASAATISVTPTVAPNGFGSPSYNAWAANAVAALHAGQSTNGDPSLPTYYAADSNVRANEVIVTGFPSWQGVAGPAAPFANELGNRMLFGLVIDGDGQQFSIDQLSFNAVSSDVGNALGFGFALGSYGYSSQYAGLLKGDDGQLFTADDVFITGGGANQLVDGLVGRGSGSSFDAYCPGCSVVDMQAEIDEAARFFRQDVTFTGTYTLGSDTGSGTFNIAAVPEPGTWALMIGGFGMAGAMLRRRRVVTA